MPRKTSAKVGGAVYWRANWRHRAFCLVMAALLPLTAQAGLIRDAEIENTLYTFAHPMFDAADISPDTVRIMIVNDPEINAYVAGGLNIFVNTGLLRASKNANMVIGVLAHEIGHISGAHLSQMKEKATRAMLGGIIGSVIGAAAVAGGAKQMGAGVIAGSQNIANRTFLSDIRLNEQSADHAALTYLDASDISSTGMLEMFDLLRQRDAGGIAHDKYLSNHPLTTERIATMRNHINESKIPDGQTLPGFDAMHARMIAKLVAFTEPYETTLIRYPATDTSLPARYARAIGEFKRSNFTSALAGMNELIKQNPKDPFLYDTKGQILFESGKVDAASNAYAKAASLKPDSALIVTEYAKTLIALGKPSQLSHAIALLERSKQLDDSYDVTWRQLALGYGKLGKLGLSYAALAEEAALHGEYETVLQHVARARTQADNDESLQLQLADLERDAKAQLEKKRDESLF